MKIECGKEFQGLKFDAEFSTTASIAAVIGRNGAGKSRLLRGISEGKINVLEAGVPVPQGNIRLLALEHLQPSFVFGFDPIQRSEQMRQAVLAYEQFRGRFSTNAQVAAGQLASAVPNLQRIAPIQLTQAVASAAAALGKDPNELSSDDVKDYLRPDDMDALGALNVSATMLSYFERLDENDYAEFSNVKHGESVPHYSPSEFSKRFGPPPWELFNTVLDQIFDGKYFIEAPTRANRNAYNASLRRKFDQKIIDHSWLSSGERVLMWLGLSMYASQAGQALRPPKLLLLDEPDGVLHPEMVQKLHAVLQELMRRFDLKVIFTTHSPTTVALFDAGPIWRVDESSLTEIDKDAAISELLVGLDDVYVHFTKSRPVYVESHKDADLYSELFSLARRWSQDLARGRSMRFIPSGPKLAQQNLQDLVTAHLQVTDPDLISRFVLAINGQGDCSKVYGAVEALNTENGAPVHGIVDWDLKNAPVGRVHVLGAGLFYNIESAVLNPLTLGLYLAHNCVSQVSLADLGLSPEIDRLEIYKDSTQWQEVADAVTRSVLDVESASHDLSCTFPEGRVVQFDRRYVHQNGHELHDRVLARYPFLKAKKPNLLLDVVTQGMHVCSARSMPTAFVDLFRQIQKFAVEPH